ncbi:hypothetical protein BGZ65_000844 [Modicella reniformis]|uniref:Uncharacterized protein n=1 Tax=Modicella reniformis TaxID=1440133 RepID=A0A9P6SQ85_9FUNG|nr:hypothetical protein BGZ65_000844 [Modicella reniformis]
MAYNIEDRITLSEIALEPLLALQEDWGTGCMHYGHSRVNVASLLGCASDVDRLLEGIQTDLAVTQLRAEAELALAEAKPYTGGQPIPQERYDELLERSATYEASIELIEARRVRLNKLAGFVQDRLTDRESWFDGTSTGQLDDHVTRYNAAREQFREEGEKKKLFSQVPGSSVKPAGWFTAWRDWLRGQLGPFSLPTPMGAQEQPQGQQQQQAPPQQEQLQQEQRRQPQQVQGQQSGSVPVGRKHPRDDEESASQPKRQQLVKVKEEGTVERVILPPLVPRVVTPAPPAPPHRVVTSRPDWLPRSEWHLWRRADRVGWSMESITQFLNSFDVVEVSASSSSSTSTRNDEEEELAYSLSHHRPWLLNSLDEFDEELNQLELTAEELDGERGNQSTPLH